MRAVYDDDCEKMIARDDIKIVHVEASSRCNSHCPMCSRYDALGYVQEGLKEENLSLETFYKLFSPEFCSQLDHVYFSGVYGDPCINPNLPTMVNWLLNSGCSSINIDTNGGYRNKKYWSSLAQPGVCINFSIDGIDDITLQRYRIGVSYSKVLENLKSFVNAGGYAQWNFIVFRHNEHQVEQARQLATELGVKFRVKVTQKFKNTKIFKVMKDGHHIFDLEPPTIEKYKHPNVGHEIYHPIKFTKLNLENYKNMPSRVISCKSKIRLEIYLSASGSIFPCCYLGTYQHDSPGSYQFQQSYQLSDFDLKTNNLDKILERFNEIESKWDKSILKGNLITCYNTCGDDIKNTLYYSDKLEKEEIIKK